ncbi:hypothetical protein MKW94_005562, partial [Papaver nudicaule]|nr:hypothetical protein [Papaver nudicaule]
DFIPPETQNLFDAATTGRGTQLRGRRGTPLRGGRGTQLRGGRGTQLRGGRGTYVSPLHTPNVPYNMPYNMHYNCIPSVPLVPYMDSSFGTYSSESFRTTQFSYMEQLLGSSGTYTSEDFNIGQPSFMNNNIQ